MNKQLFSITHMFSTSPITRKGRFRSGPSEWSVLALAKLCSSCILWTPWSRFTGRWAFPTCYLVPAQILWTRSKKWPKTAELHYSRSVCHQDTHTHTPLTDLQPPFYTSVLCSIELFLCNIKCPISSFKDWMRLHKETKSVLLSTHRHRRASLSTLWILPAAGKES